MHHVIIGGGPAAINAIETIRQFDGGKSAITLVCDEPAHSRMALPYWLAGNIPEAQTHTGDAAYFARLDVAIRFGVRAASVDPQRKIVTLTDGSTLAFDNLLIATGSSPLAPPIPGADLPGVQPLWWSLAHTASALKYAESLQAVAHGGDQRLEQFGPIQAGNIVAELVEDLCQDGSGDSMPSLPQVDKDQACVASDELRRRRAPACLPMSRMPTR